MNLNEICLKKTSGVLMNVAELTSVKAQCEQLLFRLTPDGKQPDTLMLSNRRYRQCIELVATAAQALGAAAINLSNIDTIETE